MGLKGSVYKEFCPRVVFLKWKCRYGVYYLSIGSFSYLSEASDWNDLILVILDGMAEPHSGTPYDHIGINMSL